MTENKPVRVDKFLWSVRIYKTRSIASDACRKGKIVINNIQVKPSRIVLKDEIIHVKKPPVVYTYRVIEPVENRVSARIATQYIEDITTEDERAKLDFRQSMAMGFREKGTGRPTKKERRVIDKLTEGINDI